jgi:type IV pilus assembly protein PilQ
MLSVIAALYLGLGGPAAEVRNLSVVHAANRTEIVLQVQGEVSLKHSFLPDGNRLVLDLRGAQQGIRLDFADINRGGVLGMRISQFQTEVVRVVVDLAQPVRYEVTNGSGEIRVVFPNPTGAFESWTMGLNGSPARAQTGAQNAPPPPTAAQQAERISVQIVDQPVIDVLVSFAAVAKRSIVPAPEVANRIINAEIQDQPWDLALEAILQAHGMVMRELESGILVVEDLATVAQRRTSEPTQTREFRIEFVSADSLLTTVQSLLTTTGKVAVNPTANSLLVTDTRSALERITPIIRQLDVRPAQVNISAKIVFVDRTALEDLGFVYDLKDSRGNQLNRLVPGFLDENNNGILESEERTDNNVILLGGNSIAALANANFRVANPALQIVTSLVLGRHSLFTFIDALQSVAVSDIVASPVVSTVDNREARIQVGERTPIRTIDAGSATGPGAQAPVASVRLEQTGIILQVTPHITGNQILLDIHAERSNIAAAPADIGATFQTQEADTQVLVGNGETAVIGGLTLIEKLRSRAGIPILMDLPVIGALFRQDSQREQKRDLLIMVTPHIIRDGTQ